MLLLSYSFLFLLTLGKNNSPPLPAVSNPLLTKYQIPTLCTVRVNVVENICPEEAVT